MITNDYQATDADYYIGVDSKEPVTITLPENCSNCQEIVIKAQMGPPLGNRKVTILAQPGSYIDDKQSYVISVPFGFVRLICQNNNWYIIV